MRILAQPREWAAGSRPVAIAIGVFDGLHLGHQAVIGRMVAAARAAGACPIVVTFDRHPNAVVAPDRTPPAIQTPAQRLRAIAALGVEATWLIRFDEAFSRRTGEAFVRELVAGFGPVNLVCVGEGFAFGHRRSGDVALLERLGRELGFQTDAVAPVAVAGEIVSSTRIRELIRKGDLEGASRLLGRRFALAGRVVKGDQLGRQIGFPTANLDTRGLVLPPNGVYAVRVTWAGGDRPGVMNIGVRPTVAGAGEPRTEVHLLDGAADLYDAELEAAPVARLRDEQRFESLEALRRQIGLDVAAARQTLA